MLFTVAAQRTRSGADDPANRSRVVGRRNDDVLVVGLTAGAVVVREPEGVSLEVVEVRVRFERSDDHPVKRKESEGQKGPQADVAENVEAQAAPPRADERH